MSSFLKLNRVTSWLDNECVWIVLQNLRNKMGASFKISPFLTIDKMVQFLDLKVSPQYKILS